MAFNLDAFRNELTRGGARPSLFEMQIFWPTNVQAVAGVQLAQAKSRFMVRVAEIPASQVGTATLPYFGRKLQFAGDRTFSPITVTIINDENFAIRRALEAWSDLITGHRDPVSQLSGSNIRSDGFTAPLLLTQYTRSGQVARDYTFVGAFPTNLGNISLDWDTENQIETYTCEFTYQWWEVNGGTPSRDNIGAARLNQV